MKLGFVLPLILFLMLAIAAFFVYSQSTVTPPQITIETAHTIVKYPNSQSWEVKDGQSFCPFRIADCSKPPVNIKFSSADVWSSVYGFYVNALKDSGWSTNTRIITSVPTSVVFTSDTNCQATLKPDSKFTGDTAADKYVFIVSCP